jgi:hypothetical protein
VATAAINQVHASDTGPLPETLPLVRGLVRDILTKSPSYHRLHPDRKRELAASMVRVCEAGASFLREEHENRSRVNALATQPGTLASLPPRSAPSARSRSRPIVSQALGAGSDFSGVSAQKVAGTTQAILNAVSFPRFVADLINGVFKAMLTSSTQQMNAYVELLNNVSASLSGFAESNFSDQPARQWLVEKFPGSFEVTGAGSTPDSGDGDGPRIQVRENAKPPSEDALKTAFGLGPNDSVPSGDPESALLPFAKIQMARQRQQMLATMVMLGMQRIVIDSGKINASMRFHIDTRSAAQDDQGSTFNFQNQVDASGSFGVGPWGASAKVSNTIGYVSTQRSQTTEEMNTDLDLNSSVEINFRSDYLPLNRLATSDQASRIRANTLNPEAEAIAAEKDRAARNADLDKARWADLSKTLQPQSPQTSPPPATSPAKPAAPAQKPPSTDKPAAGSPQQTTVTPAATGGATPGASPAATKPATPNPNPASGAAAPNPPVSAPAGGSNFSDAPSGPTAPGGGVFTA